MLSNYYFHQSDIKQYITKSYLISSNITQYITISYLVIVSGVRYWAPLKGRINQTQLMILTKVLKKTNILAPKWTAFYYISVCLFLAFPHNFCSIRWIEINLIWPFLFNCFRILFTFFRGFDRFPWCNNRRTHWDNSRVHRSERSADFVEINRMGRIKMAWIYCDNGTTFDYSRPNVPDGSNRPNARNPSEKEHDGAAKVRNWLWKWYKMWSNNVF